MAPFSKEWPSCHFDPATCAACTLHSPSRSESPSGHSWPLPRSDGHSVARALSGNLVIGRSEVGEAWVELPLAPEARTPNGPPCEPGALASRPFSSTSANHHQVRQFTSNDDVQAFEAARPLGVTNHEELAVGEAMGLIGPLPPRSLLPSMALKVIRHEVPGSPHAGCAGVQVQIRVRSDGIVAGEPRIR
jgi:hypothetical protein